jgi:mRNA interferase YafQ
MRELVVTKSFLRSLKGIIDRNQKLHAHIQGILQQLQENPFSRSLETHKLKGKLRQYWAVQLVTI